MKQIFFGDIHNHNACGYGVGSLGRTIDIAREHLDFFAFTGHSSWHDIEPMEGGREQHWYRGFERHDSLWPDVQKQIAEANCDGSFVAFLGFEWHSSEFGDHCVIFPDDHRPITKPDHIDGLRAFCREHNALMIPHHLAYPTGRRGVNWEVFNAECSPIVEVYSEHGNSEEDRGLYPFFNHSFGGRVTANTIQYALAKGLRFGFYASTDSHSGFPGAYGEGLTGIPGGQLNRSGIFEAIRQRRTYALTGDRIEIDFTVNGQPMGATLKSPESLEIEYTANARDELDVVEIFLNGRIVHRAFPEETDPSGNLFQSPFQIRLEWGWGPWGDLALERITDWKMALSLEGGRLLRAFPCLQSGPFDEERRHRFFSQPDSGLEIQSYSSRKGAYRQNPNQSVILECEGSADTQVHLALEAPVSLKRSSRIGALCESGEFIPTGPFPKESLLWHRPTFSTETKISQRITLPSPPEANSYLYMRVRQKNGHIAWISPVFIDR